MKILSNYDSPEKQYRSPVILLSVLMALMSCICISSGAAVSNDTLTIIHITDPHVCNLTGYHPYFVEKRKHFALNAGPLADFLKTVPERFSSDMVVITGDNVDYYEAETERGDMLDTQIEQYARLIDVCQVPVFITLGNHDIASYSVNPELSQVMNNQYNAGKARAAWSRNIPCFKNGTYYSHSFDLGGRAIRLIFLDNGYYSTDEVSDGILPFIIDQPQLRWLDAEMKASYSDVEIIFMHMPLNYGQTEPDKILMEPISKYSARSKYFNLFSVIEKNSSSAVIFAGHKHINSINNYSLQNDKKLTQVMTGAFGYDRNNWRVIKITDNKILIGYPGRSGTEYTISIK